VRAHTPCAVATPQVELDAEAKNGDEIKVDDQEEEEEEDEDVMDEDQREDLFLAAQGVKR